MSKKNSRPNHENLNHTESKFHEKEENRELITDQPILNV